ncbi:MAG TPA: aldehyde dehydrogenase (NADP(+)), partial [Cyclobacteriaceae bacterium]|nr:aldehyde dehydrogenase (NADP(+)) [Cyclobacteriaceae bacterium]
PDRVPSPKPDLRKMSTALGPVVVFGAANFPLAYSTAGGDTASALAAGCPVIVKAHPAHARTSDLVASAILKAAKKTGLPKGVFQHLQGAGTEVGQALVTHPLTKAVGFTGSLAGGKALFDLANKRSEPIPVFAEMSSTNPIILLPETLQKDAANTAKKIVASMTLDVGQFCTSPGLIIAIENAALQQFIQFLDEGIKKTLPGTMLHPGIADNYAKRKKQTLEQQGVKLEARSAQTAVASQGEAIVASVEATEFIKNPLLGEEVFGPFALVIKCKNVEEFHKTINHLHGQLTATIIGSEDEIDKHRSIINILIEKAGRLIVNGVPTGVEVNPAQQHGGPYPATTDSRFTAVGTDAIKRFVRPVTFQNFPDTLLPDELKEANPLKIWRLRNSQWGKD